MKNEKIIDLRSDTVTKPGFGMLQAMTGAEVGDDVLGEDPTVQALEQKTAELFGMEAGLFCPSGTMTNQIAIKIHTQPGTEVICDQKAHIYNYEGGGIAFNSGASVRLLQGPRGIITPEMVEQNINNPDDIHFPTTALVALENTVNKGGGSYYTLAQIEAISQVCRQHQLPLHLDGARVFNALVETGEDSREYGRYFDTISICLSKGLGIPVGSVLLGSKEHIKKGRRIRKVLGGGMRQAGYLAAAGVYALEHHVERLKEDNARARKIGEVLQQLPYVAAVEPVDTNIVLFSLKGVSTKEFLERLAAEQIKAIAFGPDSIRMVTHLDFSEEMLQRLLKVLNEISFA
ncbi:threonine aldolase family protein [Nafulsella turpanensis]|uniref:threonine aldolase family protein n=1 Tax=Nafulsella turpanensis TaxID=1265690 RepID=UPI000345E5C4|nr:GntG family PLP-dependent aldolase [Nafulsella turpanensis]